MSDGVVIVLTLLVMLVGVAGVVIPVLPGVLLVGAAGIVATFVLGIDPVGWALVVALTIVTGVGLVASYVLPARRGLRGEAARSSLWIAIVAAAAGFFVIPVVGLIVGALVGLFGAELSRTGDRDRAWATTRSVLAAYGIGIAVELAAALVAIVLWLGVTLVRL